MIEYVDIFFTALLILLIVFWYQMIKAKRFVDKLTDKEREDIGMPK